MFVTESLLAFTIFRDDFDIPFVIMFGFLLFIKCFHWLMADRVESVSGNLVLTSEAVQCAVRACCSQNNYVVLETACFAPALRSTHIRLTFTTDGPGALPRPVDPLSHTDELAVFDPCPRRLRDAWLRH